MIFPDRNPKGLDNRTIRGVSVSSRTGLAYCEIARGTSGRQTLWVPCALYCPPTTDRAYHRACDGEKYAGKWFMVGQINAAGHRGLKLTMHRPFNPGPSYDAVIHHHGAHHLRDLMNHTLEIWYG